MRLLQACISHAVLVSWTLLGSRSAMARGRNSVERQPRIPYDPGLHDQAPLGRTIDVFRRTGRAEESVPLGDSSAAIVQDCALHRPFP